ncbi:MAG: STAS/SEC14 domain-containing protein [Methylococcales bacterium]|nr:STAS/SEC14 domain-containing protein [Methylococcales bacterium]
MINELAQSNGATLAFEIIGKVSLEQQQAWIKKFDERIKQHEKISVMIIFGETATIGKPSVIYEDIKWIVKHFKRFNKIAVISGSTLWKFLITVDSYFAKMVGINEKHFQPTEAKVAWEWVSH